LFNGNFRFYNLETDPYEMDNIMPNEQTASEALIRKELLDAVIEIRQ